MTDDVYRRLGPVSEEARTLSMDISSIISKVLMDGADSAAKDPLSGAMLTRTQLLYLYLRHFQTALKAHVDNMEVKT